MKSKYLKFNFYRCVEIKGMKGSMMRENRRGRKVGAK
jgi:hypothetical protein